MLIPGPPLPYSAARLGWWPWSWHFYGVHTGWQGWSVLAGPQEDAGPRKHSKCLGLDPEGPLRCGVEFMGQKGKCGLKRGPGKAPCWSWGSGEALAVRAPWAELRRQGAQAGGATQAKA